MQLIDQASAKYLSTLPGHLVWLIEVRQLRMPGMLSIVSIKFDWSVLKLCCDVDASL